MGKIYYMMGKSSSGKDTLFREILEEMPQLKTVTLYTTRPMREGEQDGVEYFFVAQDTLQSYEKQGKVIEQRAYETVHGIWRYATVDDGQADLKHEDYLMIGTLESYEKMRSYYGEERIVPIYIEVEDGERLMRALKRERQQETPRYSERAAAGSATLRGDVQKISGGYAGFLRTEPTAAWNYQALCESG